MKSIPSILQKFIFLPCIFSFWLSQATAHPVLVDTNKTWSVAECMNLGPCGTTIYSFGHDTLIGTQLYKILLVDSDSGLPVMNGTIGMREDTLARQVFFRNDTAEFLVYDFSLNTGDTSSATIGWITMPVHVDSVDTVALTNGEMRKRLYVTVGFFPETWIEGIGSLNGLLYVGVYNWIIDFYTTLNCFHENDTLKYDDPFISGCMVYSVGTQDLVNGRGIDLFPNPSSGIVYVKSGNMNIHRICAFSICGQVMAVADGNTIDLTGLSPGVYFLSLETDKGTFYKKVIRE